MNPSGKVALITGGAGGLGRAFSRALIAAGAKVVVADVEEGAGQNAVAELEKQFGKGCAVFVKADVLDMDSLEAAFKKAKETFKRLDIVLNNAGIMRDGVWERQIDINMKGVVRGILLAFKYMGKNSGGQGGLVISLASVAGVDKVPALPIYCGTKHAVVAMTRSYGDEPHWSMTGVKFAALCPGPADTPLLNEATNYLLHPYCLKPFQDAVHSYNGVNTPDFIAEGMMRIVREGGNGSVWVANDGEIKELPFEQRVAK